jgi:hypothetical protein
MAYPTPKVEIAFDDGPYVASPTWTDVTSYVRNMAIDRGRNDDWGNFFGAASVVLDNRTRLFDPFYTSGTYYGKLLPRRQIKISAVYGATTYPVFRGFIAGWPPSWTDAGFDSTVSLSCFDALGLLQSENLPADWAHQYILTTSPRHYWPCNEPVTPFVAGSVLKDYGSVPLNATSTVYASNGDQLAVGLVNSSIQGTTLPSASSAENGIMASASFSASYWAIFDPETIYQPGGITGNVAWSVEYEPATSTYFINLYNGYDSRHHGFRTVATFDGGTARMISFSYNPITDTLAFYVDGVLQTMTEPVHVGIVWIPTQESYTFGTGQLQQLIVWDGIQTQAVFQAIYKYSTVAFSETTAARFTRLIAESSFPASLTSPPSAPASTVLDITDDAPTLTSELLKVADSEYAPLFVDRSGVLTLYYQNQIRTQTRSIVSQATYGAGGVNIGQDIAIAYDGDSLRNTAAVTMSKGGVYEATNSTSVSTYGASEASVDTQVASLANATQIGNIVTGWGGQVYAKADPFEVVLSPNNDWASTLGLELNDRITLVVQPPTGNAITTPMLLSRVSHSVVPGEWRTTLEGSARWAAAFIINQSLIGGTDLLG